MNLPWNRRDPPVGPTGVTQLVHEVHDTVTKSILKSTHVAESQRKHVTIAPDSIHEQEVTSNSIS